jgi:hypothetical protein
LLVAAGVLLGFTLSSYQRTDAGPPASAAANVEDQDTQAVEQLKEIKVQLKEINTLLHKGMVKVVVVLNPDQK